MKCGTAFKGARNAKWCYEHREQGHKQVAQYSNSRRNLTSRFLHSLGVKSNVDGKVRLVALLLAMSAAQAAPFWSSGPRITTASPLPAAITATTYSVTFAAQNGKPPYRWAANTSLPPGLVFSTSGVLSGMPTVAATYAIGVVVVDSKNKSFAASFALAVSAATTPPPLVIGPTAAPPGTVGKPYQWQIPIQGGTPPYTCTPAADSNLAEFGLVLQPWCVVQGTPTKTGSVHF